MKKIVSNISTVISLNSINNDHHIVGIRGGDDVNIVAKVGMNRYALISIRDYEIWDWSDTFSLIRELVEHYRDDFEFYQLDNWKEIKEFIK